MDPNQVPQPNPKTEAPAPQPPQPPIPPAPPAPQPPVAPPAQAPAPSPAPPAPGNLPPQPTPTPVQPPVTAGGEQTTSQLFQPDQQAIRGIAPAINNRKPLKLIMGSLLAVLLIAGGLFAFTKFSTKAEVKVGAEFITAVQNDDTEALERVIEPRLVKAAAAAEKDQSLGNKDDVYDTYLGLYEIEEGLGKEKPSNESLKVSGSGDNKHAVVGYKVGSKKVYVLEVYKDGKPKVITASNSDKDFSGKDFEQNYEMYMNLLESLEEFSSNQ